MANTNLATGAVDHPAAEARVARGKAVRKAMPRTDHAGFEPASDRSDPVAILEGQANARVQDLLPIRYGRMSSSSFAFYRGAAAIMAADLAVSPNTGIKAQLAGDAHLSNFGGFSAPDRTLVFDLNDFDETLPGPWEWDVKRLAASFEIAARSREFTAKESQDLVRTSVRGYREAMRGFAIQTNLDVWYARLDLDELAGYWRAVADKKGAARLDKQLQKARTKDSMRAFDRLTGMVDGHRQIVSDPPLVVRLHELLTPDLEARITELLVKTLRQYRRSLPNDRKHLVEEFKLVDVARKVVGVGSVGTRCWIALMVGKDEGDPLFLQFKEATESVLAPYAGKSRYANQGQRVVEGQRLMQAASDIFLGWNSIVGEGDVERDFYIRQLWDGKISANLETMPLEAFRLYARACGWTLARAHARSGDRIAIASYLGRGDVFDRAIGEFAQKYAEQNEKDHKALVDAIKSGAVASEEGI